MITPLGSLGDFVSRANGRAIYCTSSPAINPALIRSVISNCAGHFQTAAFVNAHTLFHDWGDRKRHWQQTIHRHAAGIVITRTDQSANGAALDEVTGEHTVDVWRALEIQRLTALGLPVAWIAVEFPAIYWLPRFTVEPLEWLRTSHWARLLPCNDADVFQPLIGSFALFQPGPKQDGRAASGAV